MVVIIHDANKKTESAKTFGCLSIEKQMFLFLYQMTVLKINYLLFHFSSQYLYLCNSVRRTAIYLRAFFSLMPNLIIIGPCYSASVALLLP